MLKPLRALAVACGIAALALAGPAGAGAWYKAETDRFIVMGENSEARVREYAEKLQTFDTLLRIYHPSTRDLTPATKLQVVLVSGNAELRRVQPGLSDTIFGFYAPNNEGVFALAVPLKRYGPDDVLFHEYAHHFMLENFPTAYPGWFIEGFAEYFATTDIQPERVRVGGYNDDRVSWLVAAEWLPLRDLLAKQQSDLTARDRALYYAEAWLLMHYMRSDPARAKQLDTAIRAIAAGEEPVKAFTDATGQTPSELTRALRAYRKLQLTDFKGGVLSKPVAMTVTTMPASTDDFLLDHLRLIYSSVGKTDAGFLGSVRKKAERWPDDLYAQMTLARAEFVMGDTAAGGAIMKRLLQAHPDNREVLLLAGMGELFTGDRNKAERADRYRAARVLLMKVYGMDAQDFRPLYAYARSRTVEPNYPSDRDIEALAEARALAPAVKETSMRLGQALIRRERRKEAEAVLTPLMNDPHASGYAKYARALLAGEAKPNDEETADAAGEGN